MNLRFPFRAKVVAVEDRGKPSFRLQRESRHVEDAVPYRLPMGITARRGRRALQAKKSPSRLKRGYAHQKKSVIDGKGADLGQKNPSVTKFRDGGKAVIYKPKVFGRGSGNPFFSKRVSRSKIIKL